MFEEFSVRGDSVICCVAAKTTVGWMKDLSMAGIARLLVRLPCGLSDTWIQRADVKLQAGSLAAAPARP